MPVAKKSAGKPKRFKTSVKRVFRGVFGPNKQTLDAVISRLIKREIKKLRVDPSPSELNATKKRITKKINKAMERMSVKYALDELNITDPKKRLECHKIFAKKTRIERTAEAFGKNKPTEYGKNFLEDNLIKVLGEFKGFFLIELVEEKKGNIKSKYRKHIEREVKR